MRYMQQQTSLYMKANIMLLARMVSLGPCFVAVRARMLHSCWPGHGIRKSSRIISVQRPNFDIMTYRGRNIIEYGEQEIFIGLKKQHSDARIKHGLHLLTGDVTG